MYIPEHLEPMFNETNITSFLMYTQRSVDETPFGTYYSFMEDAYDKGEDELIDELKYGGVKSIVGRYIINHLPAHSVSFIDTFLEDAGFIEWLGDKELEDKWTEARI